MNNLLKNDNETSVIGLTISSLRQSVCDTLLTMGKLTKSDVDRASEVQRQSGHRIGRILIDLGIISEDDLRISFSKLFNFPVWDKQDSDSYPIIDFFPSNFLHSNKILPIRLTNDEVDFAITDPQDSSLLEIIRSTAGKKVRIFLGLEKDIISALDEIYEPENTSEDDDIYESESGGIGVDDDIEHLRDMASEAPVIRLVSSMLTTAIEAGSSDVHMEIFERKASLRYRIDGVLRDSTPPPPELYAAVVSRIKIMAKLNIAEKRLPQDGRIILKIAGKEIDLRVSIIPMNYGEGVVLRILDRSSICLDLEILGFSPQSLKDFRDIVSKPNGIILVTGPTGSGKTTTLYAVLKEKVSPDIKVITVEDPIEYSLEGVNQIQVNPQIELTFAAGLRSILRHDPDVILIGEIRDKETAAIAIQSALTGHLVFSTLHTNDAASAFTRLMDMGIEDYLVSSSVIGVLAQRLIRKLCVKCREEYIPGDDVMAKIHGQLSLINEDLKDINSGTAIWNQKNIKLYRGKGCHECNNLGYKGRMCISEFLLVDNAIRELINSRTDSNTIAREAVKRGTKTLWQDGLERVLDGQTTIDELIRVTDTDVDDGDL